MTRKVRYLVAVGAETLALELEPTKEGGYRVLGPAGVELSVTVQASRAGLVSLLVSGQTLEVQPADGEVRLGHDRFSVTLENRLEQALGAPSANIGARNRELIAPMPGRLVGVLCEAGQSVKVGTPLVVIEAMKMQNELYAKAEAIVRVVHVSVGQTVERGALLLEFE